MIPVCNNSEELGTQLVHYDWPGWGKFPEHRVESFDVSVALYLGERSHEAMILIGGQIDGKNQALRRSQRGDSFPGKNLRNDRWLEADGSSKGAEGISRVSLCPATEFIPQIDPIMGDILAHWCARQLDLQLPVRPGIPVEQETSPRALRMGSILSSSRSPRARPYSHSCKAHMRRRNKLSSSNPLSIQRSSSVFPHPPCLPSGTHVTRSCAQCRSKYETSRSVGSCTTRARYGRSARTP